MPTNAEAIQHVLEYCAADAKRAAAYPNLRARFRAVQARLEADPIETPEGPIDRQSLIDLFDAKNNWRNHTQGSSGYIPKMVAEIEAGDPRNGRSPRPRWPGSRASTPTRRASPRRRCGSRRWPS